jgi:hypothetical protein
MAKKSGSGTAYTSKGERRSSMSTANKDAGVRLMNQISALHKGKDVVFTIPNPNKSDTSRPFIKQKVYGKEFIKSGKTSGYMTKGSD